jgi:hypothetical protein
MQLIDWLKDNGVSDAAFAERRPEVDGVIRIEQITDGKVALRDWQSPAFAQANEGAP